jgi:hypothetical protein
VINGAQTCWLWFGLLPSLGPLVAAFLEWEALSETRRPGNSGPGLDSLGMCQAPAKCHL